MSLVAGASGISCRCLIHTPLLIEKSAIVAAERLGLESLTLLDLLTTIGTYFISARRRFKPLHDKFSLNFISVQQRYITQGMLVRTFQGDWIFKEFGRASSAVQIGLFAHLPI